MSKAIYTNVPRQLSDMLKDVRNGRIGLPDLQRPVVWKDDKVCDLYDSVPMAILDDVANTKHDKESIVCYGN